jgi:hypothetical protein
VPGIGEPDPLPALPPPADVIVVEPVKTELDPDTFVPPPAPTATG